MPIYGKDVCILRPGDRVPIRVPASTVDARNAADGALGYRYASAEETKDEWIHNRETERTIDCPFDHPALSRARGQLWPWRMASPEEIETAKNAREKENKKRRKLDKLRAAERVRKATILSPIALTQDEMDTAEGKTDGTV